MLQINCYLCIRQMKIILALFKDINPGYLVFPYLSRTIASYTT